MRKLLTYLFALAWLTVSARGHGGIFLPTPPDVPVPSTPGVPGPAPEPVPSTPSVPTGPSAPVGPTTPHPASPPQAPATPKAPVGPATGGLRPSGPATGTPAKVPSAGPATGALATAPDTTSWETWWLFNQDRYLNLKAHVEALDVATGSDETWLGSGTSTRAQSTSTLALERVVPALLESLDKERQQDIVTGATIALARLADGPVAARAGELSRTFAAFANDPNQEISETSVLARGLVGDDSSAPELAGLLADSESARKALGGRSVSTRTRAFAAYALGLLGARTRNEDVRRFIVHHLVATLSEDRGASADVHVGCVIALGLAPLQWSDKLGEGLTSPATVAAARRVSSIATASRETQLETLLALFANSKGDRWVRAHIPAALAKLAEGAGESACAEITGVLLSALAPHSSERDEVVQGCVLALGRVGGTEVTALETRVRATLQRVALGGERQSRSFALIAIAQRAASAPLERSSADARTFLSTRLSDGRMQERSWAALALGILEHGRNLAGEPNSLSVRANLAAALRDSGSPDEVSALAIACGLTGDRSAVPVLLAKLERSSDPRVLGHVAVALGLIGDSTAGRVLQAQLGTARFRPELLKNTAIGLALLEDRTLVPTLLETLERGTSLTSQGAAAAVIGWIGDRRAIDPLLTLLSNRTASATARGFAAVALGKVCDRDRLPWNALITEDFHYRAATATLIAGDGTGLLEIL
ncbi:MAG: hypothetical protein JNL28_14860 [Planctomycetes bacterium]|nr:hypothetical protein [Planctomycetota bacterium]